MRQFLKYSAAACGIYLAVVPGIQALSRTEAFSCKVLVDTYTGLEDIVVGPDVMPAAVDYRMEYGSMGMFEWRADTIGYASVTLDAPKSIIGSENRIDLIAATAKPVAPAQAHKPDFYDDDPSSVHDILDTEVPVRVQTETKRFNSGLPVPTSISVYTTARIPTDIADLAFGEEAESFIYEARLLDRRKTTLVSQRYQPSLIHPFLASLGETDAHREVFLFHIKVDSDNMSLEEIDDLYNDLRNGLTFEVLVEGTRGERGRTTIISAEIPPGFLDRIRGVNEELRSLQNQAFQNGDCPSP